MSADVTTVIGQLSLSEGKWRNKAPNQVAVREPKGVDAPGAGKGDLFIVTEIRGMASNIDALEQQLAQTIQDSYYLSRGAITASLRRAIQAGNELLYRHNQQVGQQAQLLGGVVALVMCKQDAFMAQVGPAAIFAVLGDHIQRYPPKSAWLDEAIAPGPNDNAPALGQRQVIEPNLNHLRVNPADMLVLADSRLAGQLPLRDLVRAVAGGNIKTAIKNLSKIAKASNCSALVLEVVETASSAFNPLKFSAPRKISNFWQRRRQTPAAKETAMQPHLAAEPLPGEPDTKAAAAPATGATIRDKPLAWFGKMTRKSQPEPVLTYADHHLNDEPDYEWEETVPPGARMMASMAPESAFGARRHNQSTLPSPAGIFRWLGMGLIMLVALLGSGLRNILGLVLPADSHAPRQAGTQAMRQPQTASTLKLLRNIAIAIPIIIIIIVSVSYLQKGRIREAEYQEFVAAAQSKFEQAQAVGDTTSALGLMAEAEKSLVQAEQIKPETQPEIIELRRQMAEHADKIGHVQRLYYLPQLRQYTDAGTFLNRIVVQGVEVYVLDTGNDRIYHHRLDDTGEALLPDDDSVVMTARGQTVENITVADLLGITWMETGGNRQTSDLILLNSTGLLEYNPNWGITTSTLAGGEALVLPQVVDSYFGNFYILDPQGNKLWRYRPTADGYSAPPESYFPDGSTTNLGGAVDLAIDGSIYILYQDGRIAKFLGGQPEGFNVSGLDIPFKNPVSIFTAPNEDALHLYIADAGNQRIVQLNKDGSFVRQFKPRPGEAVSFANLQDIYVDEISSRMYILDSNNLYLTNMPAE
jgi:hypothetical protein